jgi:transposase-like protein
LSRVVDKHGHNIDCLLTAQRDKEAALRLLKKAIRRNGVSETITIDGSEATAAALKSYNEEHGITMVIVTLLAAVPTPVSSFRLLTLACRHGMLIGSD